MTSRSTPWKRRNALENAAPDSVAHSIDEAANATSAIALQATSGWSAKMNRIRVRRSKSLNSQTAAITAPPSFTGVVNPIDCNPVVRSKNVRTTKTARGPEVDEGERGEPGSEDGGEGELRGYRGEEPDTNGSCREGRDPQPLWLRDRRGPCVQH